MSQKETLEIIRDNEEDNWYGVIRLNNRIMTALSLPSKWNEDECYYYMKKFLMNPCEWKRD